MVIYNCLRGGYIAKKKTHLINHLNRKNICISILEDISIDEIKFMYGFEISKNSLQNDSKMTPIESKMTPFDSKMNLKWKNENDSQMTPFDSKMTPFDSKMTHNEKNKEYVCSYCDNSYSKNCNMRRHEKKCKIKIEKEKKDLEKDDEIKELIKNQKEMKEMVEKLLLEKCNTITNNTNNSNNTTNNIININNYGDEDTKYITSDYILKLLKNKPARTISELIKYTHFNDAHPENQNIKITNKKEPYIKILKNDKWELQDKKEILATLVDDKYYILVDYYADVERNAVISEKTKVVMDRFHDSFMNNNELQKDLQKKSEMIILNNS